MKGYLSHINKQDFINLLKIEEFRERAITDLKKIYDMDDDKATKVISQHIFNTKKRYKKHLKEGIITKKVRRIFKKQKQQISPNAIVVNIIEDVSGKRTWFLEDENQRYMIKETTKNLQVGMEQVIEIDNPMPIYKRFRFKNRMEIKELIDKYLKKWVKDV